MNFPNDVKYTKTDEWVRVNGDEGEAGLSDYAQDHLSDIVYVELPEVGAEFNMGQTFGSIESVKAASDLNLPVGGTISAVNETLADNPEFVNQEPYGKGWIVRFKIGNAKELDQLMDAAAYQKYCEERG
jgi:glycine cleavage system H protein